MDVRYLPDQNSFKKMNTQGLRDNFLVSLFDPDQVPLVYSDVDRSITGSAVPVEKELELVASKKEMAADYFAERREVGVINIGGAGSVLVDGVTYNLELKDALYIGRGAKRILFASDDKKNPAKFYIVSYPAHSAYPTTRLKFDDVVPLELGSLETSNARSLYKYIYPDGVKSCQLVLGLTELAVGSVWNTMPAHTHQRRSENYLYFNLGEDNFVSHFIGRPDETRHLLARDGQVVLSPSWSLHSGCGTRNYSFIWSMGGENQDFDDMDWIPMKELK